MYLDPSGEFFIAVTTIALIVGAIIGATAGGIIAYNIAKDHGQEGWDLVGWTALGIVGGGAIGATAGYGLATIISNSTGVLGFSYIEGNLFAITKTTVIGHFGYTALGTSLGYGFYEIPQKLYTSLSPATRLSYNMRYIYDCYRLGSNFVVEPNRTIDSASALYSEVSYLVQLGYQWLEDLTALVRG